MVDAPPAQLSSQELHFFCRMLIMGQNWDTARISPNFGSMYHHVSPWILEPTMDITNCLLMIGCFRYLLLFSSIPSNWLIALDDSLLKTHSHATAPSTVGPFLLAPSNYVASEKSEQCGCWVSMRQCPIAPSFGLSHSGNFGFISLGVQHFSYVLRFLNLSPRYWERKSHPISGWLLDFHEFLE